MFHAVLHVACNLTMLQDVLLQCMQLCVFKYWEWQDKLEEHMEEEGEGEGPPEIPEVIRTAKEVLSSVVSRMVKSEPEDFELDKSSDLTPASSVGQKNRVMAKLVMNIYETLLEFTFTTGEFRCVCGTVTLLHVSTAAPPSSLS